MMKDVLLSIGFPRHFQIDELCQAEGWICQQKKEYPDDPAILATWRSIATLVALYRFQAGRWVYIGEAERCRVAEDGFKVPIYKASKLVFPRQKTLEAWVSSHELLQYVLGETPEQARANAFTLCRMWNVQPIHPFKNAGLADFEIE